MIMVKKLAIITAMLVLLMLSGTPLVLAQQGEGMSSDMSVEEVDPSGSDSANAGFIQGNYTLTV